MTFEEISKRIAEIVIEHMLDPFKHNARLIETHKYVFSDEEISNWVMLTFLKVYAADIPLDYKQGFAQGIEMIMELIRLQMEEKEIKELEKLVK